MGLETFDGDKLVVGKNGFGKPLVETKIALGTEEDVLQSLRTQGWSEEAIAAFKSGQPILRNETKTPFGTVLEEIKPDK